MLLILVTQLSPVGGNETFYKPEDRRQAAVPTIRILIPVIPPFLKGGEGERDTGDEGCKEEDDGERKGWDGTDKAKEGGGHNMVGDGNM